MRQNDRTLVILGRHKARVAALIPSGDRTVARADQARILMIFKTVALCWPSITGAA